MLVNELAETISLDGTWDFLLEERDGWGTVQVPGCWEAQGYSKYPEGPAIYRRSFFIPGSWRDFHIQSEFLAVSYAVMASFKVNQIPIGEHRGLWTPFALDLSTAVLPGQENTLEVVVYKPGDLYPMRSCLAGFIPDVSTTFGGLWQSVQLRAMQVGINDLQIDPDLDAQTMRVCCQVITNIPLVEPELQISLFLAGENISTNCFPFPQAGWLDETLPIPDFRCWSPEQPNLYSVRVSVFDSGKPVAQASDRIGLRSLETRGNQLLLNGESFMVRGILSWGWEPDRIAPTYTRQQAFEEMQRVRQMGFNLIKLCLFVPNQDYFDVADEVGMLLWQEFPMWLPQVTPELRQQAPVEYSALARLTRHHPSVVLYSLGCELSQSVDSELLERLDRSVRTLVSNVLVCDNSGSGESYGGLQFDFSDFTDYHPYYDLHYFEPLLDNWRRDWQKPRPWIFGEFCDSDTFRDLESIIRANHGQSPWWLTTDNPVTAWRSEAKAMLEAQARLKEADLPFSAPEITRVSYAQTEVIRKFTLESLRRRSGMGGYIITGLRDTPISTSGIWDDFSQPKWNASQFQRVNSDSILCLDVGRRRKWLHGGDRPDRLDAQNFFSGDRPYWHIIFHTTRREFPPASVLSWSLVGEDGGIIHQGRQTIDRSVRAGELVEVGIVTCDLPVVDKATTCLLQVSISSETNQANNEWPIWVYPVLHDPHPGLAILDPTGVFEDCRPWLEQVPRLRNCVEFTGVELVVSTVWNDSLIHFLRQGGKVLLLQLSGESIPSQRCPFWREAIKLFYDHPLWLEFPQQGFTDLQFFGLASDIAFDSREILRRLPELTSYRPVLRRLDAREYRIADYIFESHLEDGVLLACSLRLLGEAGAQPSGWKRNIAGSSLLQVMLDYLQQVA
jgi:hypothetical protein